MCEQGWDIHVPIPALSPAIESVTERQTGDVLLADLWALPANRSGFEAGPPKDIIENHGQAEPWRSLSWCGCRPGVVDMFANTFSPNF